MRKKVSPEVTNFWDDYDRMMKEKTQAIASNEPVYLCELRLPNQ